VECHKEIALQIVLPRVVGEEKATLACLLGQMIKSCESSQLGCLPVDMKTKIGSPLHLTIELEVLPASNPTFKSPTRLGGGARLGFGVLLSIPHLDILDRIVGLRVM
jgi:hypothetical protein